MISFSTAFAEFQPWRRHKGKVFDGVCLARREDDDVIYARKVENEFTLASQRDLEARTK